MKILKWIAGIGFGFLVLLLLLVMVLTPMTASRQTSLAPLDREALAALGIVVGEAPGAESVTVDAEEEVDALRNLTRLAGRPSEADIFQRFDNPLHKWWDLTETRGYVYTMKRVETVFAMAGNDSTHRMAFDIGSRSLRRGDYETGRKYLLKALQTVEIKNLRAYICGELAWVEEDPEIAAALLREA